MTEGEDELDGEIDELPADDDQQLSIEQQARARGWKPLAEYNGPPARWRNAVDFIRHGNENNTILQEEVRRLTTQNVRLNNQVEGLVRTTAEQVTAINEMRELARRADDRAYKRALGELKAQRSQAVVEGDNVGFEQLDEQVREMETTRAEVTEPPPLPPAPSPPTPVIAPELIAFTDANPWFQTDKALNQAMLAHFSYLQTRYPEWPLADSLDEARRRTADEFPAKAQIMGMAPPPVAGEVDDDDEPAAPPPRRSSTAARPNGGVPPRRPRQPAGWDRIPDAEDRRQAQESYERVRKGDPGYTVDEHLTLYFDPHADVLALRNQRSV